MTFDPMRFLRGELRRSLHGPAWHGPALCEALADVSVSEAFAKPASGAHSIAQLALHAVAWMEEVHRRLGGAEPDEPARGDWAALWRAVGHDQGAGRINRRGTGSGARRLPCRAAD